MEPGKKRQDRYLRIPAAFLNSPDFIGLSGTATKLLMAVAEQYRGDNNGKLYPGIERMRAWGWNPSDHTLVRARQELRDTSLIFVTRKGKRPNKTEWWALTCWDLNWSKEMDAFDRKAFPKGGYVCLWATKIDPAGRPKHALIQNALLNAENAVIEEKPDRIDAETA